MGLCGLRIGLLAYSGKQMLQTINEA